MRTRRGSAKSVIAIVVLVVVLLSTIAYYNFTLANQTNSSASSISSLQSQVRAQQGMVTALQNQLALAIDAGELKYERALCLCIERDLHFEADKPISDYADEARARGHIAT